jgi:hypothetical protein
MPGIAVTEGDRTSFWRRSAEKETPLALFHPLEEKFVVAAARKEWVKRCEEALRAAPDFHHVASSAELFRVSARYRRPPVWVT